MSIVYKLRLGRLGLAVLRLAMPANSLSFGQLSASSIQIYFFVFHITATISVGILFLYPFFLVQGFHLLEHVHTCSAFLL